MELNQSSFERLNRLKDLTEASSYTDVMKDALKLFEWIVEKDIEGATFSLKTKEGEVEKIKIIA